MDELLTNPLELNGFAFIEFVTDAPETLSSLFFSLGFTRVAHHRHRDISLFRQNDINFLVNNTAAGFPQTSCRNTALAPVASGFTSEMRLRLMNRHSCQAPGRQAKPPVRGKS